MVIVLVVNKNKLLIKVTIKSKTKNNILVILKKISLMEKESFNFIMVIILRDNSRKGKWMVKVL